MVTYRLGNRQEPTEKEIEDLRKAEEMPIVYDEDSPELTEKMIQAFKAARKAKPRKTYSAI